MASRDRQDMDGVAKIYGGGTARPTGREETDGGMDRPVAVPSSVPTTPAMCRLADYVMRTFRVNADHRRASGVDARLRHSLLAKTHQFTPEQIEKMKAAGIDPKVYAPLSATKISAAKAMLLDIFNSSADQPWTLAPTPDPDIEKRAQAEAAASVMAEIDQFFGQLEAQGLGELPPKAMQAVQNLVADVVRKRHDDISHQKEEYARVRAKRMERKVHDIMVEGGWVDAFAEYVNYICDLGTGVMIGPVPKTVPVNRRVETKAGCRYERALKTIPTFEAVNPFDCYPAPDARRIEDGPLCIRVKYTANELQQFASAVGERGNGKVADGWMPDTLRALLCRYPEGGLHLEERYDPIRRMSERNGQEQDADCTLEGVRCFASVKGQLLREFGLTMNRDRSAIRNSEFYRVEAMVFGGYVVYCRVLDDRMGLPVAKGVFYELPDSWWGESVAEKLTMCQSIMNNAIKALITNMAAASGPMYWMNDVSRLVDKDGSGFRIRPHKMWAFQTSLTGGSGAPIGTISVPSNASELLAVFDKMRLQSDDDSGIPAYTYGQSSGQGGALRTSSGLQMFTEAASRGMKMVVATTDRLVIRRMVKMVADYVLLYDEDMSLKGDCEVNPAGVMGKILKVQQDQQRLQLLSLVTNNQFLLQMVGVKGVMALLRPSVQDMAINPDEVLPSREKVEELEQLEQIRAVIASTNGVDRMAGQQGGAPGVEGPRPVQSNVRERRAAA